MSKMSQEQINVDLFDEVKRLQKENTALKEQLGFLNATTESDLENGVNSSLEKVGNQADNQYLDLCQYILDNGVRKEDRTGTGTLSVFGYQMRFDLSEGFPLLTTKKVSFKQIKEELLWFLSGSTDVRDLINQGNHIWTPDATRYFNQRYKMNLTPEDYVKFLNSEMIREDIRDDAANLGQIYGANYREYAGYVDQIADTAYLLKNDPDSRRMFVTAWNPAANLDNCLPACHTDFQLYVANGKLSLKFNMRSNDVGLGAVYNIASYALLTHMFARVANLEVGELIYMVGDAHIYLNHIEAIKEQISRREQAYELPQLWLNPDIKDIDDFTADDIKILNYKSHPAIKMPVSVG